MGAVLYACLTSRAPFLGADAYETLVLTAEADPVSPAELNPDADADLVQICLKCLRKNPAERFASAEELAEALAGWREGHAVSTRSAGWSKRAALLAGARNWSRSWPG